MITVADLIKEVTEETTELSVSEAKKQVRRILTAISTNIEQIKKLNQNNEELRKEIKTIQIVEFKIEELGL